MTNELALQMVTVELENGEQGVFIGGPLIANDYTDDECQVDSIWFSDIQEVPQNITLSELLTLVKSHLCQQSKMLN